jgi:hypothetical protein
MQHRLQTEQSVLSACKLWLDRLPAGTQLEPVTITADSQDLAGVRGRIKTANAERDSLRRTPAQSKDIEIRAASYLRGLGSEGAWCGRGRAP